VTTNTESFGKRLQRLRRAHGIRVTDVAAVAGITEGAIRQMEAGRPRARPCRGFAAREDTGSAPDYLATGTEEPTTTPA
jgi:transcriptional regulator with XRE-family HTH domain